MEVTVLGKSPAWQDVGGACSGYLVSEGDTKILIDCGNGVFGKLRERVDYAEIDAVVVSHMHADHFFDLVPFAFANSFAVRGSGLPGAAASATPTDRPTPALFSPPGSTGTLEQVTGVWGMPDLIPRSFEHREYEPTEVIELGSLRISFRFVPHYIDAWAISVSGDTGGRFVFGADCSPNEELVEFAEGADVLMAEATLLVPEPDPDDRGHLTPFEAGEHARDAGVERLVLTHISDEVDPKWAASEAAGAFSGPVDVAFEGMRLDL